MIYERDFTFGATDCRVDVRTRGAVAVAEAWVIEGGGSRRRLMRVRALALAALELERRFGRPPMLRPGYLEFVELRA